MIIDNELSNSAVVSDYLVGPRKSTLEDFEFGAQTLNDPTGGFTTLWTCKYFPSEKAIKISNDSGANFAPVLSDLEGVSAVSFSFDQNMRIVVAYQIGSTSYLWWYDTNQNKQVLTDFVGATDPQLAFDDRRSFNSQNSDVIFSYIKDDSLCLRNQRERYTVEHSLTAAKRHTQSGMMDNLRFGFTVTE